jgi:hypothetical protein
MLRLTFEYLVEHFGEVAAWHYLAEIEKAARLQPQRSVADPEARLAYALHIQDVIAEERTKQRLAA